MKYLEISGIVLMLVVLAVTAGCTLNRPYRMGFNRDDPTQPGPNPTNSPIEVTPDYKIGFVEFDDQGWFWNPGQKTNVENLIRKECGFDTPNASAVIMVVFVHGWKNNAAFNNTNVETFRTVLKQLNDLEKTLSEKQARSARKIVGVYAGWRGLSIKSDYFPLPLGKELTIWSRKNAAQRVGGYGAMTELMIDLEELQRMSNEHLPANAAQSKLIIVGHSLGADAVYNAISQIVTERFVDTIKQTPGNLLKPLGDQIILLNPAFEAARFFDLEQLARSVEKYPLEQRPVLTVFQSEGDWATRDFFPIGQDVATVFQRHRSAFQKESNHQTVGWFEPFITHELRYNTNAAEPLPTSPNVPAASPSTSAPTPIHELRGREKLPQTIDNIMLQRQNWRSLHKATVTSIPFGSCTLISKPTYQPRNPILVVAVDTKIMKDHDDIGNPVLINFLQEYIPFCDDATPPASVLSK